MPQFFVDGVPYEYRDESANVLATCLSLGFDLPYFCWHPALNSVGACRQCAVKLFKDENDTRGRIVMACMTPIAPGLRISINNPEVVAFRAGVTEWLMVNHPHDCPICDEGGECHLQDMTVMTGHNYRRYRFTKRTHRNQNLGPFVNHEMNRCIQCYRCVRFYNDYAGGKDFGVFSWHDHVYFGRAEEGVLESEFSGNLVEVCPTGVFTDKSLKQHYTRKWDLETSASICEHCGLGCNTVVGEREGMVRSIRSRYNANVNGYFLCDRGRYGYEYVNSSTRIREPLVRSAAGVLEPAAAEDALDHAIELIRGAKVIGIGSPRASLESNYALSNLVGAGRFYHGVPERSLRLVRLCREILEAGNAPGTSLAEAAKADAVLVLGEDVTNSAPMLALALRQASQRAPLQAARKEVVGGIQGWDDANLREAVQSDRGPVFIATPGPTKLDELSERPYRAAPSELARLGFAIAREIGGGAPAANGLTPEAASLAASIAAAFKKASRPVVVCGTSCESEELIHAAANVVWALRASGVEASIVLTVPEANSMGSALFDGAGLEAAIDAVGKGEAEVVIILENDLTRRLPAAQLAPLLGGRTRLVVLDHLQNATVGRAEVVLPASAVPEGDGTFVNNEGRGQRFVRAFAPRGTIKESWRWIGELAGGTAADGGRSWENLEVIQASLVAAIPLLAPVREIAPSAGRTFVGQRLPRMSHRASGRTALVANVTVHEPPPPRDEDNPLSFSMEGYKGMPPAALLSRYWAPGWNSVQSLNKFQIEVAGFLKGGEGDRLLLGGAAAHRTTDAGAPDTGVRAGHPFFEPNRPNIPLKPGSLYLVPATFMHGSEELSLHSPGVSQLAPQPALEIGASDASRLGVQEGQEVTISADGRESSIRIRVKQGIAQGVGLYPSGLPGVEPLGTSGVAVVKEGR